MKIWILFLLGCFLVGAVSLRRERFERPALLFAACVVVAAAMYSGRFS
jgi:hypothetical protein